MNKPMRIARHVYLRTQQVNLSPTEPTGTQYDLETAFNTLSFPLSVVFAT